METEDDNQAEPMHGSGHTTPPVFGGNSRIFFVCFHLPVVVVKNESTNEWQASWSESILAKTEGSRILAQYEGHWIGTVTTTPPIQSESDKNLVRALLLNMNCTPLFLDASVRQAHYYGFCKQVLWPAFHNIDLLDMSTSGWLYSDSGEAIPADDAANQSDWDQSRLEDWWNCFQGVNQEFANLMSKMIRQGDIVWIHDYHLALLPQRLAEWETEAYGMTVTRKVFFLHIPFPTSQIFRELECGEQILQGMLHADVVGFHAFDHARHFLNAAKRILGLNYDSIAGGLIGVSFQGSTVLVSMSNVSIEPGNVDAVLALSSVKEGHEELRRKHQGRIIIGALDIGQSLSGAALKMLAYERLLQDYPAWQHRVVMVQKLLIPGSRKSDEAVTTREVRRLVKRIQDKFGPEVIDYQELPGSTLPMDQRLALWCGSDVLMSTPIREGLNHWPMEFIYSHKEPATPGVVIASEFSAISSILNGALRVNPYDIQATVATIDKALSMEMQERIGRRYRDIDFVSSSPSDKWVKNVLRDLKDATSLQAAGNSLRGSQTNSQFSTPYATPSLNRKPFVDSTAAFLARETEVAFSRLNTKTLKKAYDTCNRRVLVLDFNGTIVMKEPPGKYLKREILGTSGNKPPPEVLDALTTLSNDPKNLVYIVSGDSSENVLNALGNLNGVGLGVSNGARFSPPVNQQTPATPGMYNFGQVQRQWLTFDLGVDWDGVKRVALPVLSKYTARSNGSFVKLTSLSIGWSYYSCDPEWGSLQAAHLVLELENELRAFDVRFVTLKGIVEIVPRKLNKGLIVKKILRDRNAQDPDHPVDFLMVMGDDISDEKMFTSAFSFLAEQGDLVNSSPIPPVLRDDGTVQESVAGDDTLMMNTNDIKIPNPQYSFTVAVGKKVSHASFYVNDATEVAKCLIQLAGGEFPEDGLHPWGNTTTEQMFS
jgi:trehalose 6-phosphate synthase/phosphatase